MCSLRERECLQVDAMEQGRQRMLQKWAEPSWGPRQDLVQEMTAAARTSGAATAQDQAGSSGQNIGPSNQAQPPPALQQIRGELQLNRWAQIQSLVPNMTSGLWADSSCEKRSPYRIFMLMLMQGVEGSYLCRTASGFCLNAYASCTGKWQAEPSSSTKRDDSCSKAALLNLPAGNSRQTPKHLSQWKQQHWSPDQSSARQWCWGACILQCCYLWGSDTQKLCDLKLGLQSMAFLQAKHSSSLSYVCRCILSRSFPAEDIEASSPQDPKSSESLLCADSEQPSHTFRQQSQILGRNSIAAPVSTISWPEEGSVQNVQPGAALPPSTR